AGRFLDSVDVRHRAHALQEGRAGAGDLAVEGLEVLDRGCRQVVGERRNGGQRLGRSVALCTFAGAVTRGSVATLGGTVGRSRVARRSVARRAGVATLGGVTGRGCAVGRGGVVAVRTTNTGEVCRQV